MPSVKQILERKGTQVEAISRDATVLEAAKKMNERRIGALVVTDGDAVVGIFTERDVLRRVVAAGRHAEGIKVGEVMTTPVACCHENSSVAECEKVMTEKKIRHIPVVEGGKLRGMVSIGDIVAQRMATTQNTIEYLHEYLYGRV